MKKIIAVAVAGLALSTGAFASSFDGVNVDLGLGGAYTTADNTGNWTATDTSGISAAGKTSSGDFAGIISGGYSQEIGSGFNLAANLFYVIGHQRAGSGASSGVFNDGSGDISSSVNVSNKLNNTWGISVEPGFNFTKDTLGYVKLAWVNSSLTTNASASATDMITGESMSGSLSQSKNINGFGYGIGVKQMINDNWYVKADVMGVTYGSVNVGDGGTSVKPAQVMAFASVGYKF